MRFRGWSSRGGFKRSTSCIKERRSATGVFVEQDDLEFQKMRSSFLYDVGCRTIGRFELKLSWFVIFRCCIVRNELLELLVSNTITNYIFYDFKFRNLDLIRTRILRKMPKLKAIFQFFFLFRCYFEINFAVFQVPVFEKKFLTFLQKNKNLLQNFGRSNHMLLCFSILEIM